MKKRIIGGLVVFFVGYVVLFTIRFIYTSSGSASESTRITDTNMVYQTISGNISAKQNYAGAKREFVKLTNSQKSTITIDQKYEKIAEIVSVSKNFETDENTIKEIIKKLDSIVQEENKSGLKGQRRMSLVVGVNPELFDEMVTAVKSVGIPRSILITKNDKTNEYKELNAKKQSLETTLSSLIVLKKLGGKIDEFINLETRILDIQNQIQAFGVKLGDFDEENELCTVKIQLSEVLTESGLTLKLVLNALSWSAGVYALFVVILFFILLSIVILITIIEKLNIFKKLFLKDD